MFDPQIVISEFQKIKYYGDDINPIYFLHDIKNILKDNLNFSVKKTKIQLRYKIHFHVYTTISLNMKDEIHITLTYQGLVYLLTQLHIPEMDLNKYKILGTLQTIDIIDKKDRHKFFLLIHFQLPPESNIDWLDIILDW